VGRARYEVGPKKTQKIKDVVADRETIKPFPTGEEGIGAPTGRATARDGLDGRGKTISERIKGAK